MAIDGRQSVIAVEYLLQDGPHFRVFKQHNKVAGGVEYWVKQAGEVVYGIHDVRVVQTFQFVEQLVHCVRQRGEQVEYVDAGGVQEFRLGRWRVVGKGRETQIAQDLVDRPRGAYQRHDDAGPVPVDGLRQLEETLIKVNLNTWKLLVDITKWSYWGVTTPFIGITIKTLYKNSVIINVNV